MRRNKREDKTTNEHELAQMFTNRKNIRANRINA